MTLTWGTPVIGLAVKASGDYLPKVGEKVKLTFQKQNFMVHPREWYPEEQIINELKAKYGADEHWELLYVKVMVKQRVLVLNFWDAWGEIHLKATQALAIATAVGIAIIILAVVVAGTWAYATFRFVELTKGAGGIVIIVLIFLIVIVLVGSLEIEKGKFKIAKGLN